MNEDKAPDDKGLDVPIKRPAGLKAPAFTFNSSDPLPAFVNQCSASYSAEEVLLTLGARFGPDATQGVARCVMSPATAKKISDMLRTLVNRYELEYGPVEERQSIRPQAR